MNKTLIIFLVLIGAVVATFAIASSLGIYKINKPAIAPISSGVQGVVSIGPTCPVMRIPPDPKCADKPYATSVQVIEAGTSKNSPFGVAQTDKNGKYKITLPPGEYFLQPVGASPLPKCETNNITIVQSKMINVDLSCDSGIR